MRSRAWIAGRTLCVILGLTTACGEAAVEEAPVEWPRAIPAPVSGTLRISLLAEPDGPRPGVASPPEPLRHTAIWVNGPVYQGHADNDLRGFLDGRFRFAWNQADQIHTRVGRVAYRSGLGERELFRNLHRWEGIRLPAGTTLRRARIEIDVEEGAGRELDLLLYRVNEDWDPGRGGVDRDNNSAPALGEVWWNEAMRGVRGWGLPGAGFASDEHPRADTPTDALARARYAPGDTVIAFESSTLASYVEERTAEGEPLLLLLKLSDYLEDTPETVLHLYSSNHGDSRNTARRPRLLLEWDSPHELLQVERAVVLEHGRSMTLPRMAAEGVAAVSASFESDEGYASPTVLVRGGRGEEVSDWLDATIPVATDWDWVEVRLETHVNPVPLGGAFEATIRDTWVPTGPPEEQRVPWVFVSPSGARHEVVASYAGDHEWRVTFTPDEAGRWQYRWSQNFIDEPYESVVGVFDVTGEDREAALAALRALIDRVNASDLRPGEARVEAFGEQFLRLQRALMRLETPETFPLDADPREAASVGTLLDEAREALGGTRPEGSRLEIDP